MKTILSAFIICLWTMSFVHAQTVKELNNTAQGWSGGVCCRSGVNYNFNLEFTGFKNEPVPDTIWVGGECIPVTISDSTTDRYYANTFRTRLGKTIKFHFSVGISHDEMDDFRHMGKEPEKPKPAPIQYTGVALVSWYQKGVTKRQFYVIKKVQELEYQSYP